jgi:NAD(P)-dependent dehydrogenase (short-subunit alcohol dehydrogenase family)
MSKRIALIGGTSGIGAATVEKLLEQGHELHIACRRPEVFTARGISAQFYDALSPTAVQWPDTLDGFIYFPGSITLKPFHRMSAEDFARDLQINLLGVIPLLQSALPALKSSGQASVVLFSTIAAAQGMPFHASIAAAKGAVEGLAKSLAAEWAPIIRVNVIAPSLTDTPLAHSLLSDDTKRAAAAKRHPLQQVGQAADVAGLIDFLVSDQSRFLTGQILRPDGGLSSVRLFS